MRSERTQVDEFSDQVSLATGLDFTGVDDLCRQEFKEDCDINTILSRFGAADPRPVRFGESLDADYDLLIAFEAVRNAQRSFEALPQELTSRYSDVSALVDALDRGELTLTSEPPPAAPVPASNPAGSAGVPPAENAG